MAASVDAAAAAVAVAPPAAVEEAGGAVEQARTLIGALNLLSRNLPLPPDVLRAVSSIYHDGGAGEEEEEEEEEEERRCGKRRRKGMRRWRPRMGSRRPRRTLLTVRRPRIEHFYFPVD
ncbi:unnamed protein product [Miscanthus lutarioriparius]|uniref:Uncharacterized protein n=1 Tax=Miscanthus lutarioriparius TaxID=422564 RepID=A0A811RSG5_9POAL|nr:unnamed protein product [Miscanthus lutarioriparius]